MYQIQTSKLPEIDYIFSSTGGIICCYINGILFQDILIGTEDFEMLRTESVTRHQPFDLESRLQTRQSSNVLGDVSGLISSFQPALQTGANNIVSASFRQGNLYQTKQRVATSPMITETHPEYNFGYQVKDNRLHGSIVINYGGLTYIAIAFEGTVMMDCYITPTNLLAGRIFTPTNVIKLANSLNGSNFWFDPHPFIRPTNTQGVSIFSITDMNNVVHSCSISEMNTAGKRVNVNGIQLSYISNRQIAPLTLDPIISITPSTNLIIHLDQPHLYFHITSNLITDQPNINTFRYQVVAYILAKIRST